MIHRGYVLVYMGLSYGRQGLIWWSTGDYIIKTLNMLWYTWGHVIVHMGYTYIYIYIYWYTKIILWSTGAILWYTGAISWSTGTILYKYGAFHVTQGCYFMIHRGYITWEWNILWYNAICRIRPNLTLHGTVPHPRTERHEGPGHQDPHIGDREVLLQWGWALEKQAWI